MLNTVISGSTDQTKRKQSKASSWFALKIHPRQCRVNSSSGIVGQSQRFDLESCPELSRWLGFQVWFQKGWFLTSRAGCDSAATNSQLVTSSEGHCEGQLKIFTEEMEKRMDTLFYEKLPFLNLNCMEKLFVFLMPLFGNNRNESQATRQ